MSDIVWQDPPPPARSTQGNRKAIVAELKKNPGVWALVTTTAGSRSDQSNYRTGFPGIEATSRKREDGKYDIYVRWPVQS